MYVITNLPVAEGGRRVNIGKQHIVNCAIWVKKRGIESAVLYVTELTLYNHQLRRGD